jgi:predicted RNA methylase
MVAYNLLLSIFPLALVALFIAGRVLRSQELQDSVLLDLERIFPSAAETTLSDAVRRLQESSTTTGILAIIAAIKARDQAAAVEAAAAEEPVAAQPMCLLEHPSHRKTPYGAE